MNKQGKLRKVKKHRTNSQMILYHVRFSTDTVHNNSILFFIFFGFFLFSVFFYSLFFFAFCLCVCFLNKKYILVHIRLCGKVSNKKNFVRPMSENLAQFKLCNFSFFHMQPPPKSKF